MSEKSKLEFPEFMSEGLRERQRAYELVQRILSGDGSISEDDLICVKQTLAEPSVLIDCYGINPSELVRATKSLEAKLQPPSNLIQSVNNSISLPEKENYLFIPQTGLYVPLERTLKGMSWESTMKETFKQGKIPQTPRQIWDSIFYSLSNPNIPNCKKLSDDYLKLGEIRGDWASVHFVKGNGFMGLDMKTAIGVDKDNNLLYYQEPLEECLWDDCYIDISPENIDSHGLVRSSAKSKTQKYIQGKTIHSWHPRENAYSGFVVNSGRAYFNCNWDSDPDSWLGERPCIKEK